MTGSVRLVDTTLRDGQQSLWALRMRTAAMLPTLEDLDAAGFDALEYVIPGTQFVRAVRELREDPWDWMRLGTARVAKTRLRFHGNTSSYFAKVPSVVQDLLLERLACYKMSATRLGNPWNDFTKMPAQIERLARHGIGVVLNLIYSVSPRHTREYFVQRMQAAAATRPMRICVKDVGGLLTPEVAASLLPDLIDASGGVPLEFHGHCNNGFGPYNALIAADAGIPYIHTAIPPLSDASSLPSVFELAENLRARGIEPQIDLEPLRRVSHHFMRVARYEKLPLGERTAYDEQIYTHQVPGGMRSNLELHLRQVGLADRLQETLGEAAAVRRDLGYPIMVTPLSQFVGTQAALNVMAGNRYETVSDEVIQYALGHWGAEAVEVMDPAVREIILGRSRAMELEEAMQRGSGPELSLAEVRRRFGGVDDEELILRVLTNTEVGSLGVRKSVSGSETYADVWRGKQSVARLIAEVSQLPEASELRLVNRSGSLVIRRSAGRKD